MLLEPVETELFEDSQTLFREVNERVREVNLTFGRTARLTEFVCECSDPECTERLALSIEEFDAVRAHPDRRIIRAGHTSPTFERTVAEYETFSVVERLAARRAGGLTFVSRSAG